MPYKAAIAILLFAWCASASAQEQTGKIVFYRESHFRNYDYKPPVYCDGIELARIVSGSYLEVTAPPGRHTCVAETAQGPATTIDIVPGSVAYLRVDITPTVKRHAFLITATEAEYKLQPKLTPVASTRLSPGQPSDASVKIPAPVPTIITSHERSADVGGLTVTTANINTRAADYAPDRNEVAIFLTVNNTGKSTICASFTARLRTTFGFEYLGTSGQAPPMHEMLPNESEQGSYVFNMKNGVQPLELILELDGGTVQCKDSGDSPIQAASVLKQIHLDVHDLPELAADDPRSKGSFRGGVGGVSYPTCIYCPNAKYTKKARDAKLEGTVQLKVIVLPDGTASNIEVVKGLGQGLDEETVNVVRTWRFRPAVGPNGDPVATVAPIEITFRLVK
jgi:TonB family protein